MISKQLTKFYGFSIELYIVNISKGGGAWEREKERGWGGGGRKRLCTCIYSVHVRERDTHTQTGRQKIVTHTCSHTFPD